MKTIKLTIVSIFLFLSNQASSSIKYRLIEIDTLQGTTQYHLFSKTSNIESVQFGKSKKSKELILYFKIDYAKAGTNSNENKTGVQSPRQFGDSTNPVISNVRIITGKYTEMKADAITKTATLYTLTGLQFPLRLQVFFMGEILDFELAEPGKWNIDLILKK